VAGGLSPQTSGLISPVNISTKKMERNRSERVITVCGWQLRNGEIN